MGAIDPFLDAAAVMPVVTLRDASLGADLARALVRGGCPVVEVTLRTDAAFDAIRAIAMEVPEAMVGAGTVLNGDDLRRAADAGARFAISPGLTPALLDAAENGPIPLLPGVATASDVMTGRERGLDRFKFFPAEAMGGVVTLQALAGPFASIRFCPTGGISRETAPAYLALDNVACVGGSWVAPSALIAARQWTDIEALARAAAGLRG